MFLAVGGSDRGQDTLETGPAPLVVGRKISSAIERFPVGSKERGERPPSLAADGAYPSLIAAVDVGTLIAVDLHCDEVVVHDLRDFRIVIRFAVHHVAPVTPDGADVEQHGLVFALGRGKGL